MLRAAPAGLIILLSGPLAAPVGLYVRCWPTLTASSDGGLLGRMRREALGLALH
jgi:hypothetical protein